MQMPNNAVPACMLYVTADHMYGAACDSITGLLLSERQ